MKDASIKLEDGAFMAELVSTCSKFDAAGDPPLHYLIMTP